jgi:putative MATE family efflux protein
MSKRMPIALDDEHIGRLLFKLTVPAFFGMFVMTLYNVIDTIFIGHYVGSMGIAGLSIVFPVQMLAMGIGQMTGMGGASVISRLIGSKQISRAEQSLGNALTSTAILSAIIMIIGLSNVDLCLKLTGASETVLPYARDYFTIILFGMFFQTLTMAMNGLVRAEGNAFHSMMGMIIGAVLNIILCAIFIIPLHWGVKGSALATVIAQSFSFAYFVWYYFSRRSYLKIHLKNFIPKLEILKPIYAIGVSSLAMILAGSLSAMLVNRVLVSYGGDYAISTFGIINRIMMFATMPGMVIGQGLQPILGYNYGAKRYDLALKSIKITLIWSTGLCLFSFLLLFFIPEIFIRVFSTDAQLIEMSVHASKRIFLVLYLLGFAFVGQLVFQALGKAVKSFITSLARPVLFLIPLVIILPRFFKLDGVWIAFAVTDVLTAIMTVALLIPQIQEMRKGSLTQLQPVKEALRRPVE